MKTKDILKNQNAHNVLTKKSKEKLLATLLASGLITCTLATPVSAISVETVTTTISEVASDTSKTIPEITKRTLVFNMANPSDLVIDNIDLSNVTVDKLMIYGKTIDASDLKITENSITIPKNMILAFNFMPTTYTTSIIFEDGSYVSGRVFIKIVNDASYVPPIDTPDKDDNNKPSTPEEDNNGSNKPDENPPSNDDSDVTPTIKEQALVFNRDRDDDVVIRDVDFKGLELIDFYIYGKQIDVNDLIIGKDSITIPKNVLLNLNLKNSTYYASAIFSNGKHVSGVVSIKIIDNIIADATNQCPSMLPQNFEFDINNPKGLEITNVNFDGANLKTITIGNKILNSTKFKTTNNSIIISADVLKSLGLGAETYQMVFTFSNGSTFSGYSDLVVFESTNTVIKPAMDIVVDSTKNEIEIPNLIPEGANITSIKINNKVLNVIYRTSENALRTASNSISNVVYVENDKLIIPTETLEYIGTSSDNYEISIRLADDSVITQQLTIKSASNEEIDKPNIDTNKPDNTENNNKNNSTSNTNTSNSTSIPKTSDTLSTGLLASLLGSMATLGFTMKKKK